MFNHYTSVTTGRISSAWPFPVTTNSPKEDTMKLKDNPNFDKEHYKELKEYAKNDGIKTFVSPDGNYASNGYVVAYARSLPGAADCKMIRVAISFCSIDDDFKKKVGKYHALLKFISGEFIQLPLAQYGDEEIEDTLRDMFSYVE